MLYLGGIPDQDVSILEARFNLLAEHVSEETGVPVPVPSVPVLRRPGHRLGTTTMCSWPGYGGLTGVQARLAVPGSRAVAQRSTDENFTSRICGPHPTPASPRLQDLKGRTFTFGSESSTSGNLMPRYFPEPGGHRPPKPTSRAWLYSGSHDATWKTG